MNKKRAIQNTLARLGMQAKPTQIVAALALHGIILSERLVRAVLMEMLKTTQNYQPRQRESSRTFPPQKVMPRRGNRS